ncbi:MAG: hypothetical protein ACFNO6_00365 [Anaeroglobus sp.]|jgi:hypothetical protein|nr:MAG TPA: tail assembly chaperone protein [Caudoviricetes sp.]
MATNLSAFLKENVKIESEVGYVASDRITENGKPVEWKIQVLTAQELEKMRDRHTKKVLVPGTREYKEKYDAEGFNSELLTSTIIYPELDDIELQNSWGVNDADQLLKVMLKPGEYADLANAVSEAQGFKVGMDDKVKEVKN